MSGLNHRTGHASKLTILLLLALSLLFARDDAARAAAVGGNCTVNTVAYRASDDVFLTTSTTPVSITGMASTFTLAAPGCLVVQFTAYAYTEPTDTSYVTFDLDNNASSRTMLFANKVETGRTDLVTAVHVFRSVAAGTHTVKLKLQTLNGTQVQANGPKTVLVHYRK